MMLYTLPQLVQLAKEDLGIRELPPSVTDKDLLERVKNSAIKDLSIIYPRIEEFTIGSHDLVTPNEYPAAKYYGARYRIPDYITKNFVPMDVISVKSMSYNGIADVLYPYASSFSPTDTIASVAGIKAASAVGHNIINSVTHHFDPMTNIITIYNGWSNGDYQVTMTVSHDENLSTIPATAMLTVRDLITNDIGQYLYNTLKRKDKLDTPAGNIDLRIDDLADCGNKRREILEKLSEDASLDFDVIDYF